MLDRLAQIAQAQSSSNTSCPPFLSNYTSTISNISIFTSFLETYESVGLDTDPSSGFSAFAPTDRAWGRVEQILSEPVPHVSHVRVLEHFRLTAGERSCTGAFSDTCIWLMALAKRDKHSTHPAAAEPVTGVHSASVQRPAWAAAGRTPG